MSKGEEGETDKIKKEGKTEKAEGKTGACLDDVKEEKKDEGTGWGLGTRKKKERHIDKERGRRY